MARKRLLRAEETNARASKIKRSTPTRAATHNLPVLVTASLSLITVLVGGGMLLREWHADSKTYSSLSLTFGPPENFYINRSAVPVWHWQPDRPFARQAADFAHPVVLRHAVSDQWRARKLWNPDYLRSRIRKLSGVYENTNRWFGPYFDSRKPLASLVRRVNPYQTDLVLSGKSLIQRISQNLSQSGQFIYYSGAVDDFGEWAVKDIQPLEELLTLNPSVSSVNAWLGPPNVIAHCHYDGYHNFYVQLFGRKRFWLAPPSAWPWLEPAPFLHPSHAQCQVNLSDSSIAPSQRSKKMQLMEVELQPGDLLYLPPLWFHHVQSLDVSISVNVWTDTDQSAIAADMFDIHLPDSSVHLQVDSLQTRAVLAVLVVDGMLSAVCSHMNCSGQVRHDDASLPKHEAWQFLYGLYTARFKPLIESSGLPLLDWPGTPSVVCRTAVQQPSGGDRKLSSSFREIRDQLRELSRFINQLEVYSRAVERLVAKLPWQTRALWLGNLVEYILANHVGPGLVARLLLECVHCLLDG